MNDVLAEDALAEDAAPPAEVEAPTPTPDEGGLQGYNPNEGEEPLEAQAEAEAAGPVEEEPETFPENPDDLPAGPSPEEEEREPTAEEFGDTHEERMEVAEIQAEAEEAEEAEAEKDQTIVGVSEPEPEVQPPPPPPAVEREAPKSKSRVYLIFEEHGRSEPSYKQVPECLYTGAEQIKWEEAHQHEENPKPCPTGELRSRNGDNARRAAYRRLAAARENEDLRVTLVVVAESSWRPTPIKPRQRNLPPALEIG